MHFQMDYFAIRTDQDRHLLGRPKEGISKFEAAPSDGQDGWRRLDHKGLYDLASRVHIEHYFVFDPRKPIGNPQLERPITWNNEVLHWSHVRDGYQVNSASRVH